MRKRGSLTPFVVLGVFVFAAWLYFSPYLALRKLQKAAEAGDTRTLNAMVDFPALRESVKEEVRTAVAGEISPRGQKNPLAALGGVVAGALAAPVVDAFVTPTGIAALTRGERPDQAREEHGTRSGRPRVLKDVAIDRGYERIDTFVIQYRDRETGEHRVALVLEREGLAAWKLTGVRLGSQ